MVPLDRRRGGRLVDPRRARGSPTPPPAARADTETTPASRNSPSRSATASPSRPYSSNSRRSRLDDTWMSMLGLIVGSTPWICIVPVSKNRARMSLRLVATCSPEIGSAHAPGHPAGAVAPGSGDKETLEAAGIETDLHFAGTISVDGKSVAVRTVFAMLREHLDAHYRPEQAAEITGVNAEVIRRFARELRRRAGGAHPLAVGRSASSCTPIWRSARRSCSPRSPATSGEPAAAGARAASSPPRASPSSPCRRSSASSTWRTFAAKSYIDPAETERFFARYFVPGTIWHEVHGGLDAVSGDPPLRRPSAPRPAQRLSPRGARARSGSRFSRARQVAAGAGLDLRQRAAPLAQQHRAPRKPAGRR